MAAPQPKPAPQQQPTPPKPSRMSLAHLVKGRQQQPVRVVLYGVEGIGKSTFGANAPAPIFLGAEDGTSQLDVTRFPAPERWVEVLDAVRTLTTEAHDFKTLVLDTLDWAEPLLWQYVCDRDGEKNIEAYGYGKGYAAALDEWRVFLAALEKLRRDKGMHLVLIAHSWIKPFKNPEGPDFDRYELKLHPKAGGLIKEWADCVLFANYETLAAKDDKTKRIRGVDTGARLLYTQRRAAYDAKNRYDLPESLALSWPEFEAAVAAHRPADPRKLTEAIQEKAKALGGDLEKAALEAIKRAAGDAVKLAQLNNWATAKLAEKEN
jgi:hypothetical protein